MPTSNRVVPNYATGRYIDLSRSNGLSIFYPMDYDTMVYDDYINNKLFSFTRVSSWPDFLQGLGSTILAPGTELAPPPGPLDHLAVEVTVDDSDTPTPTSTVVPTFTATPPPPTLSPTVTPTATMMPTAMSISTPTSTFTPTATPTHTPTVTPTSPPCDTPGTDPCVRGVENPNRLYLPIIK